jgi:hypothetical protein
VQVGQNTPLVMIAQIKPIFVSFSIPQEFLDEIRRNQANQELVVRMTACEWRRWQTLSADVQ